MSVVLINPANLLSPYPPMGLVELGTFLETKGYNVEIVDFSLLGKENGIKKVVELNPSIIGVSVLFGIVKQTKEIIDCIKKEIDCIFIAGGYYPTFRTNHCLNNLGVNFVILGEGEISTLELVDYITKGKDDIEKIAGIAYLKEGKTIIQEQGELIDLKTLPVPNLSLVDLSKYPFKKGKKVLTVSASRGCTGKCAFCSQTKFWQGVARFKSPENVKKTINQGVISQKIDYVRILDDNFLGNKPFAKEISLYLKSISIPWECQFRTDEIDIEMLRFLADCGLDRMFMGIETASPEMQKTIKKKIDLNHSLKIIKEARKLGVNVKVSFQIGIPGETQEDIERTIEFAQKLESSEIAIFTTTPFPGTEIEKIARKMNLISEDTCLDLDPSTSSMGTGFLSKKEVDAEAKKFIDRVNGANWGHHSKKGRRDTLQNKI